MSLLLRDVSGSEPLSIRDYPIPQSHCELDFTELDNRIKKEVEIRKNEMLKMESEAVRADRFKLSDKVLSTFKNLFK